MSWQHLGVLVAFATVVTAALTPLARLLGLRWGIVAEPGARHVHRGVIPQLGGAAMFVGFMATMGLEWAGETYWGWGGTLLKADGPLWGFLLGLVIILLTGLLDDIFELKPGWKLLGQIAAAGVAVRLGLQIEFVANPFTGGLVALDLLSYPLTMLWIVAFANIINLIDGLDGLAAGVTAIAGTSFLVLAQVQNELVAAAITAALVGVCLGFLRYNFNPASIFMGDSGSLMLGYTLACVALMGVMKWVAGITLAVPLLIVAVPIIDTSSAIFRRVAHRRPVQEADSEHIHHRLLGRGFNTRQTVLIIYVWSIALAVGGYAMRWAPGYIKLVSFLVLAVLSGFMASWLGLFRSVHHHAEEE